MTHRFSGVWEMNCLFQHLSGLVLVFVFFSLSCVLIVLAGWLYMDDGWKVGCGTYSEAPCPGRRELII